MKKPTYRARKPIVRGRLWPAGVVLTASDLSKDTAGASPGLFSAGVEPAARPECAIRKVGRSNEVNADVEMIQRALEDLPAHTPSRFAGAIGMMAREWGGMLKATERAEYRRLERAGGIFENYITEGDGLRQAAANRNSVYNVGGANAERQASQFRQLTEEFLRRCPS